MSNDIQFSINDVINNMDRNVFCSEADFKYTLARSIESYYSDQNVRTICEFPTKYESKVELNKQARIHIDILVIFCSKLIPVELKYRTKFDNITEEVVPDLKVEFDLKNQSAYDAGCYGFIRDICRIAEFINQEEKCSEGYAVFLTNDEYYLKSSSERKNSFSQFNVNNIKVDQTMSGKVNGQSGMALKIETNGKTLKDNGWRPYKNTMFQYKVVSVS